MTILPTILGKGAFHLGPGAIRFPKMCTLRAITVCGIAQLALDLFDQNFPLPLRAVTFDDVSCTSITMALSGIVTDTDRVVSNA